MNLFVTSIVSSNRRKNILKSKHFRSFFFTVFLVITSIFLFVSFLLFVETKHRIKENQETKITQASYALQDIINATKNNAIFIGSLPSVKLLINNTNPSIDYLSGMINDVSSFTSMYDYDNMVLFFDASERIYDSTSGIYLYSDYFDQDIFQTLEGINSYEKWIFNRSPLRYYEAGHNTELLTYVRRLPFYESTGKGYITFSISISSLQSTIAKYLQNNTYPSTLCFENQLLWGSSDYITSNWDTDLTSQENMESLFPDSTQYTYTTESGVQTTVYITTWQLIHAALPLLGYLLCGYFIAILLGFIIAVLYSIAMIKRLENLMCKIGLTPYTENKGQKLDEYMLLSSALDNMNNQIKNIDSVMKENTQLIQDQLLYGILYEYIDLHKLSSKYEENGIVFPHDHFCLILIALPHLEERADYATQEEIRLLIRNNAIDSFSNLGQCYSLYLGIKYVAVILNTEQPKESLKPELLKICKIIRTSLAETLSLSPLFSISICSSAEPHLSRSLVLAQRVFMFSSDEEEDFVYFSTQQEYPSTIEQELMLQFTRSIINKDSAQLELLTEKFSSQYLSRGIDCKEARRLTHVALCSIFVNLLGLNIEVNENLLTGYISKIADAEGPEECSNIFCNFLSHISNDTAKMSGDAHVYVRKAINYLKEHYYEPLSIPQIASHIGVSSIYLNRVFKLSTEKTLSEYLNYYRITQSIELLKNKSNTINYISEAIGYNDVRSYIRFFKKFYGMTPGEYRKTMENKSS